MIGLRNHLPLLHIVLELPYVAIRTSVMRRMYGYDAVEYIALTITIWKWTTEIALYDTTDRQRKRRAEWVSREPNKEAQEHHAMP